MSSTQCHILSDAEVLLNACVIFGSAYTFVCVLWLNDLLHILLCFLLFKNLRKVCILSMALIIFKIKYFLIFNVIKKKSKRKKNVKKKEIASKMQKKGAKICMYVCIKKI